MGVLDFVFHSSDRILANQIYTMYRDSKVAPQTILQKLVFLKRTPMHTDEHR
ncbi:hypothetical protein FJSC11DRAFT_2527 [Fischerella thermalis JSC-11]|jgi:hypothetical protein|uniref:Uncharacterized protein n=1 Tax=Fischerella thermalis JSC-11 TaxID=741277 RepID=G6FUI0_9CYAN|nr:hypothetical protein FJSC11DRAFT_2527 [Fischerella thermalis JSC-11]